MAHVLVCASNNGIMLQVVSLLKDDNTFVQELFARLKSSSISAESKKNLVNNIHLFFINSLLALRI